jgi:hypothetical protein
VQVLDSLLSQGVILQTDKVLAIFDKILASLRSRFWNEQEAGLLIHALCVLPFIEDSKAGVAKIREVIATLKIRRYELRELVAAVGYSRCTEGVGLLRDLASDPIIWHS